MKITVAWLKEKNACIEGVTYFETLKEEDAFNCRPLYRADVPGLDSQRPSTTPWRAPSLASRTNKCTCGSIYADGHGL